MTIEKSNMIVVTTRKEGKEKNTAIVLDKVQAFQLDGNRLDIFVDGSIFSVCLDIQYVWSSLVNHFSAN